MGDEGVEQLRQIERDWPYGNLLLLRESLERAFSIGRAVSTQERDQAREAAIYSGNRMAEFGVEAAALRAEVATITAFAKTQQQLAADLENTLVKENAQLLEARAEVARREKERDGWQALYAQVREVICCCNRTDTPEKGPLYDYTCEWCAAHPEGDVAIGLLERAEAAEARIRELEEK
jgi:hypothetical protein